MMNRKKVLLLVLPLLLTGCIKQNLSMKLETNNNFSIEFINAVEEDYYDSSTISSDDVKNLGYTVSDYNEDGYKGYKGIAEFKSIDDVSTDKDVEVVLNDVITTTKVSELKLFKKTKNGSISTYTANFVYNYGLEDTTGISDSESTTGTSMEDYDLSEYTSSMELFYKITLPVKPLSSNATSTENNGLTQVWELTYGEENKIQFSFQIDDKNITKEKTEYIVDDSKDDDTEENSNDTEKVEVDTQEETNTKNESTSSGVFSKIIALLLVAVVCLGFVALKVKMDKKDKEKNIYHSSGRDVN